MRNHDDSVCHDGIIVGVRAIPFQHGEFRQMQIAAFAVAEHARELKIFSSPAASNFLAANSGEVRK